MKIILTKAASKELDKGTCRWMSPKSRPFAAFTLVEVVVATAIFALVAGAMINAMILTQYSTQAARNRVVAMNLITSRIEDLGTWTDATMRSMVNGGGGTTNLVETSIPSVVTDVSFGAGFQNRNTTISSTQNYYQVTVQVNWNERAMGASRSRTESVTTYVFPTQ